MYDPNELLERADEFLNEIQDPRTPRERSQDTAKSMQNLRKLVGIPEPSKRAKRFMNPKPSYARR